MDAIAKPQLQAVLVPGILGSVLYYPKGAGTIQEIWGENFLQNYRTLISDPGALTWKDLPASTRLLKAAYPSDVIHWPRAFILRNLLRYLQAHPEFGAPGGTVECSYDWRDSIINSADTITKTIQNYFATSLKKQPAPSEPRLVF